MKNELITGYIMMKEGSTVADQFAATFIQKEEFENQNINALKYILPIVNEILAANILPDMDELQDYADGLSYYIKTA